MFLDGAAWSKQEGVMVESEPKKLFVSLPVLYVSANTKSDQVRTRQILEIIPKATDSFALELSNVPDRTDTTDTIDTTME